MAQPEKYLIISRGNPGDRKQTAFKHEASARKRFDDDKAAGRAVWLYGPVTDQTTWNRPLLEQTGRTPPKESK